MALTKFTEKLISDSFKTSISGSDNTESASFSSRVTLVEGGTTSKTLVSSSAQIATDISGSFNSTSSSLASRVTVNEGRVNQGVKTTDSPTFAGGTVTGDFTVGGTLTAQEVHTEFESASILFTSGSTIFGNSSDDVHEFKGNKISGSSTSTASLAMISLADKIEHIGDTNNTIEFGTDEIKLRTGGSSRLIARDANVELYNNLIVAGTIAGSDDITLDNNKYYQVKATGGSAIRIAGLANDNNIYLGAIDDAGASVYIREDGSNVLTITGGDVTASGDFAVTDRLTVGAWDNSNSHGHANLNISADANEGADSYLNFAAGLTTKGYISYDHHATATSQAMKFYVGDAAVEALAIDGSGNVGIGTNSMSGHVHTYSSQRYMLYLQSTYGTARKYWFRNEGTLQLGEGSQGDAQVGFTFDTANKQFGIGTRSPDGVLDCHYSGTSVFKVQSDGVAVGNANPGTYGTLHVISAGDTSITGSTFYDGYGETGLSGNPVGPHTLCLSSTAEASTDVGIQNMGPSLVFRGQPGTGLDGGATFSAIAGTFDASNSNYQGRGNLRFFTSAGYVFSPQYGTELKERMKITYSGEIHLGYSGGGYVYLYEVDDNSNYFLMYTHTDTTFRLNHNGSGNDELELQTDGDMVIQGTLTESSDVRLKENIETIPDALSKVNQMRGVSYNKIGEEKVRIGMVADEVEKIIPELVSIGGERGKFDEDGFDNVKSLKYTNMVGVLVEAVKELTEKNDALEKRMEALESN